MQKLLLDYVQYNQWANNRILQMVSSTSDEQFKQVIISSFPSIQSTLLHIWDAQLIWLSRMQGNSPSFFPSEQFSGGRQEVVSGVHDNTVDYLNFVNTMISTAFECNCSFRTLSGKPMAQTYAELILHCMNHSTFHRGQIVMMLRQLGHSSLLATDYIEYLREKNE